MTEKIQKLSADEMLISECLNFQDKYYKVPDYQRRYSWNKEQLEDFWYDLDSLKPPEDEHFLGSIVVITRGLNLGFNKLELVDGQQRLTTIMLLLRNIANRFQEHPDKEKMSDKIERTFINAENNKADTRFRLELGNLDQENYKLIMNGKPPNKEDNLFEAFEFFKNKLSKLNIEEIQEVYDKLLGQMLIVVIKSQNEKSAFRLFETLNDRGLDLSAIDLMKNYLLKVVVNNDNINTEIVKDRWEDIIINIQNIKRKVRFFRHYLMAFEPYTKQKITQKKVYDRFKEIIDSELDVADYNISDYIEDIENKSEWYRDLSLADISIPDFSDAKNSKLNAHVKNLNDIGTAPSRILLLKAIDEAYSNKIGFKEIIELFKLIEIFSVRRIIGQYSTGELDTIYNKLAINSFGKSDPISFIKVVFEDNVPGDDEFLSNFKERNFRNNDQTKYFLDKMEKEKYMVSGEGKNIKGRKDVHIEHIAPTGSFITNKYSEWGEYFQMTKDEFDDIKTRIGNLTLFEHKLNIRASDEPFEQKKKKYIASDFQMTQSIAQDYDKWTKANILHRTDKLANLALEIWSF